MRVEGSGFRVWGFGFRGTVLVSRVTSGVTLVLPLLRVLITLLVSVAVLNPPVHHAESLNPKPYTAPSADVAVGGGGFRV